MGVNIHGDVGHVTNFEKGGTQYNVFSSPEYLSLLQKDLETLKSLANNNDAKTVQEALNGINEKNESKVLTALKKLVPFIGRVSSTIAGHVIVAYMRSNNLIP